MLYYVFSGPLSLRAYVPEIKFNNKKKKKKLLQWQLLIVYPVTSLHYGFIVLHMLVYVYIITLHESRLDYLFATFIE